jgi:hypothetical protein
LQSIARQKYGASFALVPLFTRIVDPTRIPIHVFPRRNEPATAFARNREPVTCGVPFPQGECHDERTIALVSAGGLRLPLQTKVLDRWPDSSIRWLLADFQVQTDGSGGASYELISGVPTRFVDTPTVSATEKDGAVTVTTGVLECSFWKGGRFPLAAVTGPGGDERHCYGCLLLVEDQAGKGWEPRIHQVTIEASGPIRAVVRLDAVPLRLGSKAWVDVVARLHFFAGSPVVRFELALCNRGAAEHSGGFWDLGDSGSVYFHDVGLVFSLPYSPTATAAVASHECGDPLKPVWLPYDLYQESSGGERWDSANHVNRFGKVPLGFRGYRSVSGSVRRDGARATPIICISNGAAELALAMPRFWENFPKGISASDTSLVLSLFPRAFADVHELQGGERKTHVFAAAFGADGISSEPLAWLRAPLQAVVDPSWTRRCEVYADLSAGSLESRQAYFDLVARAVEGSDSFLAKREVIDEFGWRNFGDLYADHETVHATEPFASHYNNQYDGIAGFAVQYLRTADGRWGELMDDLAAHVVDIDIYHCQHDNPAYNNGLFWHTNHHTDAGTASHRTYPRRAGQGGGPSAEHNYTTGLMLHHFLTGSDWSREAVLQLAQWVLEMDDGRLTAFWWLDRERTGRASATASPDYHGPGRGAGNSINALLDAHRLTGESRYLQKADELVKRCVHPRDDPESLGIGDPETRWSYTVFLQVLGKYLEDRAARGMVDVHHEYARQSLLTYARWMADHERPFLDSAERLQFPTETWAAQDLRKVAVFEFAATHAADPERRRFLERADFFFDYAIRTLTEMPTSVFTRPTVLMLSYGVQRPISALSSVPGQTSESVFAATEFDRRARFVSYKTRVIRKATGTAALASAVLLSIWLLLER